VRTALAIEPRDGIICVFMPPLSRLEDYLALLAVVERTAREIGKPETKRDFARLEAMLKACFDSQDYVEGRRAFMEKRKPNFQGK